MSSTETETYQHEVWSGAFLERARANLAKFDSQDDASALFYAALELRYGIEKRLYEYINSAMEMAKRESKAHREYAATKLLKRYLEEFPDGACEQTLTMAPNDGGPGLIIRYTPVTKELATNHGRLGELLHAAFFEQHPFWWVRERLSPEGQSLTDVRAFLQIVFDQLAEANSGELLSPPVFRNWVEKELDGEK